MKKLKRIFPAFLLLFFAFTAQSQDDTYFVTVIKGDVKKANKTAIKVGEKLQFREKVIFSKKDDMLVLLHPEKGRFVVTPGTANKEPSGDFFVFLNDNLHLQSHRVSLSSRGDPNLEAFFSVNPAINESLLLIGETKIGLHSSDYLISDPNNDFFFLQYTPVQGKPSNNKLHVVKDSLIINKEDFLFNGAYPADSSEIKLGFIKNYSTDRKITKISSFKPVFMSIEECKNFLIAVKQSNGSDRKKTLEESITELYYFYGKPDLRTVSLIYDSL